MTRRAATATAGAILLAVLVTMVPRLWTPPARGQHPAPWQCTGNVTNRDTVGTIHVPAGQTCRLDGVNQTGRVHVEAGGVLAVHRSTVLGDLTAGDARDLELRDSTVTGTLRLAGVRRAAATDNVFGDVRVNRTAGPMVLTDNVVEADLIVYDSARTLDCHHNVVKFRRVGNCGW